MALEFTGANFEAEVLKADKPVLVDFWASWCMPCRMLAPTIDALYAEFEGKAKIGKLDVDAHKEIASRYEIMSIPTVLVFKDGKMMEQFLGAQPKTVYADAINKYLK